MSNSLREAYSDARRAQILEAAVRCFAQNGFHKATVHDIAREAGLSQGAMYLYFQSKDQVIESMLEQVRQGYQQLLGAPVQDEPTLGRLHRLADAFFSPLADPALQPLLRLRVQLWAEALRNPRLRLAYLTLMDSAREPIRDLLWNAQQSGEMDTSLDPDALARAFVSLFQGLVLQMALSGHGDVPSYLQVVKSLVTALALPARGAPAPSPAGGLGVSPRY